MTINQSSDLSAQLWWQYTTSLTFPPNSGTLLHFQNELALHNNICKIVVRGGQTSSWKEFTEFIRMYSLKLCPKYEVKGLFLLDSKVAYTLKTLLHKKCCASNVSTSEMIRNVVNWYYITLPLQTRLGGTPESM